jgi:site-specific DNA recombinase
MLAVIYARVSTEEQAKRGLSIPAQIEASHKYAKEQGLNVVKVFQDEGESALSANRPEFLEMIAYCKTTKDVKAVIVYDTSRFARNRQDAVLFKRDLEKRGVRVHYASQHITDDAEGRFMEGILEVIDEHYSRMLARVVKRGLIASAKKGNWIGGTPIGYKVVKTEQGRRKLEVEPREAEAVRLAVDLFEKGYGCRKIAEQLNDKGFQGRFGKPHSAKGVHGWLTNGVYCGDTIFNRRTQGPNRREWRPPEEWVIVENTHEPLIDRETFKRLQKELRRRGSERHPGEFKSYRRFAGLMECSHCGKTAQAETGTGRHGTLDYYYACRTFRMRSKKLCAGFRVRSDEIEGKVIQAIDSEVFSDKNIEGTLTSLKEKLGEIGRERAGEKIRIQRKLEGIRRKLRQVILLAEDSLIDREEAGRRTRELQEERGDLEAMSARLDEGLKMKDLVLSKAALEAARKELHELIAGAEPRVQREFFRKFVRSIRTDGSSVEMTYNLGSFFGGEGVRCSITSDRGGRI